MDTFSIATENLKDEKDTRHRPLLLFVGLKLSPLVISSGYIFLRFLLSLYTEKTGFFENTGHDTIRYALHK